MTILVSSVEEEQAILNLFKVISRIYHFVEKDYSVEDVFAETLDIHEILSEFPDLLDKNVCLV